MGHILGAGVSLPVIIITLMKAFVSVDIRRLSVPRWVQNGTEEAVILDCEYVYTENDIRLVVKWFFNDSLEPVYQWIPELNVRHSSGVLQDKLDHDFSVNTLDTYSRYRALRIIQPTVELSGKYTCLVTSLASQDSREQEMTVYVPEKHFNINSTETQSGKIKVVCSAGGLFPTPQLSLFLRPHKSSISIHDSKARTVLIKNNATYDISVERTYLQSELADRGVRSLECLLEIPGTSYTRRKGIDFKGIGNDLSDHSGSEKRPHVAGFLLLTLPVVLNGLKVF